MFAAAVAVVALTGSGSGKSSVASGDQVTAAPVANAASGRSEHTDERNAINAAVTRLLTGTPLRSNGALTIVALAQEADVNGTS